MRKLESIDKVLLFALMLFTFMLCNSINAQAKIGMDTSNENIYGEWVSYDGEHQLL